MNPKFNKTLIVYFFVAVSFVFNSPIQAYVLPGPHILHLMVEKLGDTESLFVSQKLIFYRIVSPVDEKQLAGDDVSGTPVDKAETRPAETIELEGTLRYVFSQAFRSDDRSPDSERIHIYSAGRTLTIIDGSIVAGTENPFDLYKDLLLFRSRKELTARLSELGVDVSVSSLGRFEGQIAFVVGAQYPDESVPQIWFDKETLLPIRWIIRGASDPSGSDSLEFRYLIWWQVGKTRYPSQIEFYQDGNLVRVNQAKNFEENPAFSEELFDIEYLRTIYPQALSRPIASETSEEPSEVQKTIEEFRRIFE